MNKKIIKILCIIISCIYFTVLPIIVKSINDYNLEQWVKYTSYILILTLCIQFFLMKVSGVKFISLASYFLLSTYIFHFSQVFLMSINYDFGDLAYSIAVNRYGLESFKKSIEFCIYSSYGLYLGMLLANFSYKKINKVPKVPKVPRNKRFLILGIIFILIAFPIDFFVIFIPQIKNMLTGGYLGVHDIDIGIILKSISYLLFPGVYLVATSSLVDKRKSKIIVCIYIIYKLISMITGLRAYNLMNIVLMIYLYCKSNEDFRFNTKYVFIALIVSILGINLLNSIREIRISGINILVLIKNLFDFQHNIIFELMSEFGITINVVTDVIINNLNPKMGAQILSGIASIVPGVSYIFPSIDWQSINIAEALNVWNWGGSYIADFYFDFGNGGIIACGIYGYLILKINTYVDAMILEKNYEKIAFISPIIIEIMFTIRSSIYKIPRMVCYYCIVYALIKLIANINKGGFNDKKQVKTK